ncbi:MAG: class I SAM-dependent methyltransferase [Clostridiales bacterium]|nr:class I SAM-dependent methyltransferase [Clostridiales bacterium]MBS5878091.1 class I SAM-dependent methyltransferase [Clostridiales bacterium]MDU0939323.1 class I SAM-dependent methyltransferase [Clostridiales bacterium]MDU1042245.1 class I SAM-dependent methyltransferase [Clostridiales bacterium]MDU3489654.1 class I SAM-dependent methyltransferase [Clostridiales bacterium]
MSETNMGNPAKQEGQAGVDMLNRMNESHGHVTDWALSILDVKKGDRVLDIGCGGGATISKLLEMVGEEGHVSGIDHALDSVTTSINNNLDAFVAGKTDIAHCSIEKTPFYDDLFDKVITVESLYFWPDPKENVKEVYRFTKPGGKVLLVLDIYNTPEIMEAHKENIEKYDLYVPTVEDFENMLREAGFSEVKIHLNEGTSWIAAEGIK